MKKRFCFLFALCLCLTLLAACSSSGDSSGGSGVDTASTTTQSTGADINLPTPTPVPTQSTPPQEINGSNSSCPAESTPPSGMTLVYRVCGPYSSSQNSVAIPLTGSSQIFVACSDGGQFSMAIVDATTRAQIGQTMYLDCSTASSQPQQLSYNGNVVLQIVADSTNGIVWDVVVYTGG